MATQNKTFACTKDNTSRTNSKRGQGVSDWLMVGRDTHGNVHRAFLDFDDDWTGVGQIVMAQLVLTTSGEHNFSFGSTPKMKLGRLTSGWSEGNADDGDWHTDDYVTETCITTGVGSKTLTRTHNDTQYFDITPFMEQVAPKSVRRRDGTACGGAGFYGLRLWGYSETDSKYRTEVYSRHYATTARRPSILLTYDVGTAPPNAPTLGNPSGDTDPSETFEGTFSSQQDGTQNIPADILTKVEVRVWDSAGTTQLWSQVSEVSDAEKLSGTFSIGFPEFLRSGTTYKWDARVQDQAGQWSAYATKKSFVLTNTAPTVSIVGSGDTISTLRHFQFRAAYSDADSDPIRWFRFQLQADGGSWTTLLWDTDVIPATSEDIAWAYGGSGLAADTTYEYRCQVGDSRGGVSSWSTAGHMTTSADFEAGDGSVIWDADEEAWVLNQPATGYNRVKPVARIILKSVGTSRGPGDVKAIITDAANIGASIYANSPGEFFFTLPSTHPQIGECEPFQTHYALQMYLGDRWVEKFAGILIDFDATEDEVVFYGVDYLGMLTFASDERYNSTKPNMSYTDGGSKYSDVAISTVIYDQINEAKTQTDSWCAFIGLSSGASVWDTFAEKVTILTTFNNIFSSVTGLMESHKAGTGRRSRLWVERLINGTYRWRLADNYGKDRPNVRLELGGLLNGYRVIGFGDFGTMIHGIGRVKDQYKVYYKKAESPINDGVHTATGVFGRVSKAAVWQDLLDENDLGRRVKEAAMKYGKIGKRMALPISVDSLMPLDGYDILDSIPAYINDGAVNTDAYGSGYLTILGVAWRLYPDGHTDLVLTVIPKEDGSDIDPDLIPTAPILPQSDWTIGYGGPDAESSGMWYLDQVTGDIYYWNEDTQAWELYLHNDAPTSQWPDPENPDNILRIEAGKLMVSVDGGLTWTEVVNPVGILAPSINQGNMPGGSNLIPDGSFEMAAFPTAAATVRTWDTDSGTDDFETDSSLTGMVVSGSGTAAVLQLDSAT